jgi:hypothetical protein
MGSDKSDKSDTDDDRELKVSTLLERANSSKFIVPAGIFMIHPTSRVENHKGNDGSGDEETEEIVPMSTKLKDFIYSDNKDQTDNYNHQDQLVPPDLYEKLLSMVSPSDTNRYWDPKSTTRKRRIRNQDTGPVSSARTAVKSKTRRK